MKYLKMLGLAAIAPAALMAFAVPTSATQLTSPAGTQLPAGTEVHLQSKLHTVFDSVFGKIECGHTMGGETTTASGSTVAISLSSTVVTNCTTATVHVIKPGSLNITATGGGNGSVTSTGSEWTMVTFGLHCIFSTNNTAIGTLIGGNPAVLGVSANIPRTGGSSGSFCGASAPLTGSSEVTSPKPLFIS